MSKQVLYIDRFAFIAVDKRQKIFFPPSLLFSRSFSSFRFTLLPHSYQTQNIHSSRGNRWCNTRAQNSSSSATIALDVDSVHWKDNDDYIDACYTVHRWPDKRMCVCVGQCRSSGRQLIELDDESTHRVSHPLDHYDQHESIDIVLYRWPVDTWLAFRSVSNVVLRWLSEDVQRLGPAVDDSLDRLSDTSSSSVTRHDRWRTGGVHAADHSLVTSSNHFSSLDDADGVSELRASNTRLFFPFNNRGLSLRLLVGVDGSLLARHGQSTSRELLARKSVDFPPGLLLFVICFFLPWDRIKLERTSVADHLFLTVNLNEDTSGFPKREEGDELARQLTIVQTRQREKYIYIFICIEKKKETSTGVEKKETPRWMTVVTLLLFLICQTSAITGVDSSSKEINGRALAKNDDHDDDKKKKNERQQQQQQFDSSYSAAKHKCILPRSLGCHVACGRRIHCTISTTEKTNQRSPVIEGWSNQTAKITGHVHLFNWNGSTEEKCSTTPTIIEHSRRQSVV